MPITRIGQVFSPLLPPTGPPGAVLVEDGPQIINARQPEAVVTDSQGRPRLGHSRLPADYAFRDFLEAKLERSITDRAAPDAGRIIDVLA